jgi:effector-binding domain-containing protein
MASEISIRQVQEQAIAVIRDRIPIAEIGLRIRPIYDRLYAKVSELPPTLHNVIVYRGGEHQVFDVEVGVQVSAPFADFGEVICSRTPAGTVATSIHLGRYASLPATHEAIGAWCERNGRIPAGVNWEVYGDWTEDEAKLRTDVFWLLR